MTDEKNKGGRPAHHSGEVKKAAIAVRTAPSIRDALKVAADAAGRSVTQEVEARLAASFERDGGRRSPETEQLLNRFAAEIAEIEAMTGRPWHRHRETAGAVLELFSHKPPHWIRTDDPYEDEAVMEAWNKLRSIIGRKSDTVEVMRDAGLTCAVIESPAQPLNALARAGQQVGALTAYREATQGRWRERHQLESLDIPDNVRRTTLVLIEHLEDLDREEHSATEAYKEAMSPFLEAELTGRQRYRDLRQRIAREQLNRNEQTDLGDWVLK